MVRVGVCASCISFNLDSMTEYLSILAEKLCYPSCVSAKTAACLREAVKGCHRESITSMTMLLGTAFYRFLQIG